MAAAPPRRDWASLQLLLKAASKDFVRELCVQSFQPGAPQSRLLVERTAAAMELSPSEAQQLLSSLHVLSHHVLFHGLSSVEQIQGLFPSSFHCSLKNLLCKILLELSSTWKTEVINTQVSLPQLKTLDWRVDMVTSSDSISRVAVPSCLLQVEASQSSVTLELSRETLDTMLDGLERLRLQLSAVAGK